MINVRMNYKIHSSHSMSEWRHSAIVLPTGSDRFCQIRECKCGAEEVVAGGAGSHWIDEELKYFCVESEDYEEHLKKVFDGDWKALVRSLLDDFHIGDYVYDVRDEELKGWDGPRVKRFSYIISRLTELVNQ